MMTDEYIRSPLPTPVKPDTATSERDAMNLWSRGIDWCVFKQGRQWRCADCFGFPILFKTKTAAYEAATAMVLEASRRRAEQRNTAA